MCLLHERAAKLVQNGQGVSTAVMIVAAKIIGKIQQ